MQTTANVAPESGEGCMVRQVRKRIGMLEGRMVRPRSIEPDYENDSASNGHWIQGAVKHPGALHRNLGIPQGKKVPAGRLRAATRSSDPTICREANLAEEFRHMQRGGKN